MTTPKPKPKGYTQAHYAAWLHRVATNDYTPPLAAERQTEILKMIVLDLAKSSMSASDTTMYVGSLAARFPRLSAKELQDVGDPTLVGAIPARTWANKVTKARKKK